MAITINDAGELGYGTAFALAAWWDTQRIESGRTKREDVFKSAAFWTYLGIGLPATLASVMNWMPRQRGMIEHISHGFLFYLPTFVVNTARAMGKDHKGPVGSAAIAEAQQILASRRIAAVPALGPPVMSQRASAFVAPEESYQLV